MALPNNYRWVLVGNLQIRKDRRAPHEAPSFSLVEIIDAVRMRLDSETGHREFGAGKSRLMWCSEISENDHFYCLLLDVGDKNTTGVSFLNFDTRETRDIPKAENEGGHYSAHLLIEKQPDATGGHLVLVEKVPGVHFASLKDHFNWVCREDRFYKTYQDHAGKERISRPVMEVVGYQANTIREALRSGRLQDVEFVKYQEAFPDGLDEDPIIQEIVHHAKWDIKRQVSEDEARSIFRRIPAFLANFQGERENAEVFIRIKTRSGQIRRSEIETDEDAILEQAFVQNEIVNDFAEPLHQRHVAQRDDMIRKISDIAVRLREE